MTCFPFFCINQKFYVLLAFFWNAKLWLWGQNWECYNSPRWPISKELNFTQFCVFGFVFYLNAVHCRRYGIFALFYPNWRNVTKALSHPHPKNIHVFFLGKKTLMKDVNWCRIRYWKFWADICCRFWAIEKFLGETESVPVSSVARVNTSPGRVRFFQ